MSVKTFFRTGSLILVFCFSEMASANLLDNLLSTETAVGGRRSSSVDCRNIPREIQQVAENMIRLRRTCSPLGQRSPRSEPIVVTDFSNNDGNVYVFNDQGRCFRQFTSNSWGRGAGDSVNEPRHCSVGESNYSPAGLHLIVEHNGEKYDSSNSFAMMELDDQGSLDRGILFHGGYPSSSGASLGCSALSDQEFSELQECAPVNGLAYNYFGNTPQGANCARSEGFIENGGMPTCDVVSRNLNRRGSGQDPRNTPTSTGTEI